MRVKSEVDLATQKRQNFKNWYAKNKEKKAVSLKQWKKENPERVKVHAEIAKIRARRAQLKLKYGITPEQYKEMLWLQDGHCVFCDRTPDQERYGVLTIDHDHKTGRIRGLLCITHNRSLGVFGDNEEGILKVLAYVRGEL